MEIPFQCQFFKALGVMPGVNIDLLRLLQSWSEQKCPECEEHVSALKHDGCDRTVAIFPYGDSGERLVSF